MSFKLNKKVFDLYISHFLFKITLKFNFIKMSLSISKKVLIILELVFIAYFIKVVLCREL